MLTSATTVSLCDILLPYAVICFIFYVLLTSGIASNSRLSRMRKSTKVLLVIAHPDDECMFFAPTIAGLIRKGIEVHLLCLSSGNFEKLGETRKKELTKSCAVLGIPTDNITIIEHSELQDEPTLVWDKKLVGKYILDNANKNQINVILSFDSYGVSGHLNHRSVYYGLRYLKDEHRLSTDVLMYALESVSIPRHYFTLWILDLPLSYWSADLIVVTSWRDLFKAQKACLCHWSQMKWFRFLHISFSRFMLVNTFHSIDGNSGDLSR